MSKSDCSSCNVQVAYPHETRGVFYEHSMIIDLHIRDLSSKCKSGLGI